MKFRIVNNLPATEATLDTIARELDVVLPSCLVNLLLARDGFQVYQESYNKSHWDYRRAIHTSDVDHYVEPDFEGLRLLYEEPEVTNSIVGVTQRLIPLYLMFAEDEDKRDRVKHDPKMLDDMICVGSGEDRMDEQFTYWMPGGIDETDVYLIELPVVGGKLGYKSPPPIRKHLEKPYARWDDFIQKMDVKK